MRTLSPMGRGAYGMEAASQYRAMNAASSAVANEGST